MPMNKRCFVKSAVQVSCQKPLSDDWLTDPVFSNEIYARAQEPDITGLISRSAVRRMSLILRRAVATAVTALRRSGHLSVDGIITGTGAGCMENSERFLVELSRYGETGMKPTLFMQSTHNTIGSQIAITLNCHGYNNTYSHRGISFDSALLDAWMQIRNGNLQTILVGSHDEITPLMSTILHSADPDQTFIAEASMSAVLSSEEITGQSLCELLSVDILHRPGILRIADMLDASTDPIVLIGNTGKANNDAAYMKLLSQLTFSPTVLHFKHLFGESNSASAIAFYVAATLLNQPTIPKHVLMDNVSVSNPDRITLLNHTHDDDWSIIRLKSVNPNAAI